MSEHHLRAVVEQLSAGEQAFFEKDPARSWLAQMSSRLVDLPVKDAAEVIRSEIPALSAGARRANRAPAPIAPSEGNGASSGNDPEGAK